VNRGEAMSSDQLVPLPGPWVELSSIMRHVSCATATDWSVWCLDNELWSERVSPPRAVLITRGPPQFPDSLVVRMDPKTRTSSYSELKTSSCTLCMSSEECHMHSQVCIKLICEVLETQAVLFTSKSTTPP